MENRREDSSHEEIPEELMHDGELQPADLWTLSEMREHPDLYERACSGEAVGGRAAVEWDPEAFLRRLRLAASAWPEVPEAARERPTREAIAEAWQACVELASGRPTGDALPALSEFEDYFSSEVEAAEQELRQLRDENKPGAEEMRERVGIARANFSMKRHAITRFRRKFAFTFEVPRLSEQDVEELTRPGNPGTAANNPEQIRDVLGVALRVADDCDPDGKHISFEEVRTAVKKKVPMLGSASGIDYAVKNAVEHMQCEYGADVPKPTCTVAYYANNDSELRKALETFMDERFPKNSDEGFSEKRKA